MKNETALTAKEEKVAKRCAVKYKGFIVRHANIIGWLGVIIFALAVLPHTGISENIKTWIRPISIFMIFYSVLSELTIIIGKLYERLNESNNGSNR